MPGSRRGSLLDQADDRLWGVRAEKNFGMWFSGHSGVALAIGLDDLGDLNDSMT